MLYFALSKLWVCVWWSVRYWKILKNQRSCKFNFLANIKAKNKYDKETIEISYVNHVLRASKHASKRAKRKLPSTIKLYRYLQLNSILECALWEQFFFQLSSVFFLSSSIHKIHAINLRHTTTYALKSLAKWCINLYVWI